MGKTRGGKEGTFAAKSRHDMVKTVAQVVTDVRTAIDEIGLNDGEFLPGTDEEQLETLIKGRLCEAVDWVHSSAALELMSGDEFTHVNVPDSTGSVSVTDMIRFVQGKGNGWKNAVRELTEDGTAEYDMAVDEYVGASVDRPAVVLKYVSGGRELSLLPVGAGSVVYVKKATTYVEQGSQESIKVDKNLYAAMLNYLGGLVLMVLNDDRGENMVQMAKGEIGLDVATK